MLASGILEKGDIIYMEPVDWNHSNSDCHIGFFWGSSSSEDLYWHSSSHADGIVKGYFPNSAGGNVIPNHAQVSRSLLPCHQDVAQGISDTA